MSVPVNRLNPPIRLSPFGMETCSICDAPTTHTIPTPDNEYLPYCVGCAGRVKAEFPDSKVYLYAPREVIDS